MLRLPVEGEESLPLVIPGPMPERHDDEEHGGAGHDQVRKRRRKNHHKAEVFDETFSRKEEMDPKIVRGIIGSVCVIGVILVVGLLWPREPAPEPVVNRASLPPAGKGEKSDDGPSEEDLAAERQVVKPTLVEEELIPVIRKFLEAESAAELAPLVRHSELTVPRIEALGAGGITPVGFSKVIWGDPPVRTGDSIRVLIQDGEFAKRNIHLTEEDGWKVDWESWVGWSEIPWEQLKRDRPTEPLTFRVVVSDVDYYNFEFNDEAQWSCYRLESREGEHAVYGYVPRAGLLDVRLRSLERVENRLFTLRLRYPDGAKSDNQLLIDEILAEGWMLLEEN